MLVHSRQHRTLRPCPTSKALTLGARCRHLVDGDILAPGADKTKDFALRSELEHCISIVLGGSVGDGSLGEYLIDNVA